MEPTTTLSNNQLQAIRRAADRLQSGMVDFARRLIQTPSPSGDEAAIARLTIDELRRLGYDDVWTDRVGNVIGAIRGTSGGPSVQFNAHLDHVAPGNPSLWPHPAYGGVIDGDVLFGRGASDVKGAMAAQVYLAAVLNDTGLRPAGDVIFAGVVLEEVGGFGSDALATEMPTTYAVLAEATKNQINRGHRGRVLLNVTFTGLSAHASAPERARNPHFAAARFLLSIEHLPMVTDSTFGGSSVAPTLASVDQTSANVTPAVVDLFLDWRNIPDETTDMVLAEIRPLVESAAAAVDGVTGSVEVVGRPVTTYTGIDAVMPSTRGFVTPVGHPLVRHSQSILARALARPVDVGAWTFATDGGHLSHHGITTIGFAPGEERFAHTIHDQISLSLMHEALIGNAALALAITATHEG
ncbi:MAG: M20 family metallopeptidase [Thermomicrobiales bacterium]